MAFDQVTVQLADTSKIYGDVTAVNSCNLRINKGELFTLLGPSGSGKTTILRMVAGLIEPSSGRIFINGVDLQETQVHERDIGLVFQSLALFPHMSVFGNLAFPLQMRRVGRKEIARKIKEILDVVRLPNVEDRNVKELSGGQQQRVALARALIYRPSLLLLDEPLGALDRRLREEMQIEIVRLHQELDVTIVNVTHDQREALMLSDRIGVMNKGHIEQVGSSFELYRNPETRFVAEFLGDANIFDGIATFDGNQVVMATNTGKRLMLSNHSDLSEGMQIGLAVRAECIRLGGPTDDLGCLNQFRGSVSLRSFEGSAMYYEIIVPGLTDRLKVSQFSLGNDRFERGDSVTVGWDEVNAPWMPLLTER
jgi:ABC-type Fe3+/spermidine/putrescine transport system ATPase subunit